VSVIVCSFSSGMRTPAAGPGVELPCPLGARGPLARPTPCRLRLFL
jgi:hypothetical protein